MPEISKNFWTILFTSTLYILSNTIVQCEVSFQARDSDLVSADEVNDENDIDGNSIKKRAWKNFSVWGKRALDNFQPWDETDAALNSGLHIAQMAPEKRKWAKFSSWGKRDIDLSADLDWNNELDSEKRKMEMVDEPLIVDKLLPGVGIWNGEPQDADVDKRKWSNLAVWGKRSSDGYIDDMIKRWAKFTSWGKRANGDDDDDSVSMDKRKWAQFASWGKRDNSDDVANDVNKRRKWSTLAAWGKRAYDNDMDMDKRKWAQFASWGKRFRRPQAWYALRNGGKRRWSGLTTWGKR